MVDVDTMVVPLKNKYQGLLPLKETLFDQDVMFGEGKEYKNILKPVEDKDTQGNQGMYFKHQDYGLTILANMSDEGFDDEIL